MLGSPHRVRTRLYEIVQVYFFFFLPFGFALQLLPSAGACRMCWEEVMEASVERDLLSFRPARVLLPSVGPSRWALSKPLPNHLAFGIGSLKADLKKCARAMIAKLSGLVLGESWRLSCGML